MFSPPFVGVNGVNMTFLLPIHIYNIYLKSVLNTPKVGYSQWKRLRIKDIITPVIEYSTSYVTSFASITNSNDYIHTFYRYINDEKIYAGIWRLKTASPHTLEVLGSSNYVGILFIICI